jgi:predicted amidohydrolase
MRIACIQFSPTYRNKSDNIDRIAKLVANANADLCVLPELALTGYFFKNVSEIQPLAEPIDGQSAKQLSEIARNTGTAIISGFLEVDNGHYYNSSLAFDRDGALAGHYRKVHLFYYETQIFSPGDLGFPVFDLTTYGGNIKCGMLICYDWRFPEAARALALQGAELIAMPSNIVTTTGMLHTTLQTRAFENKVALAFADRIGTETVGDETLTFRGESCIINYNGEIFSQASSSEEEHIDAELDLAKTRDKQINQFNNIFTDRPPTGYGL